MAVVQAWIASLTDEEEAAIVTDPYLEIGRQLDGVGIGDEVGDDGIPTPVGNALHGKNGSLVTLELISFDSYQSKGRQVKSERHN